MFFASDNWAGAHPAINERLSRESTRFASAYGSSALDLSIEKRFNEIFEREVAVFFVATGTAANSLSLASIARPGGLIPERRHQREMELGVADTPMYDVTAEGSDTDREPRDPAGLGAAVPVSLSVPDSASGASFFATQPAN